MRSLALVERVSDRPMISDRRRGVRYKLRLPVLFHWKDGSEFTEGGYTHDIALDGALICGTKCPPIGCDVRVEVLIPSPERDVDGLRIQCVGKVAYAVGQGRAISFGVSGVFDDDNIVRQIVMGSDG